MANRINDRRIYIKIVRPREFATLVCGAPSPTEYSRSIRIKEDTSFRVPKITSKTKTIDGTTRREIVRLIRGWERRWHLGPASRVDRTTERRKIIGRRYTTVAPAAPCFGGNVRFLRSTENYENNPPGLFSILSYSVSRTKRKPKTVSVTGQTIISRSTPDNWLLLSA